MINRVINNKQDTQLVPNLIVGNSYLMRWGGTNVLHFRFHLLTRLPVTQVDSTVLPNNFSTRFYWTPGLFHWNKIETAGHV